MGPYNFTLNFAIFQCRRGESVCVCLCVCVCVCVHGGGGGGGGGGGIKNSFIRGQKGNANYK